MIALPCRTEEEEQEDKSVLVEVYSLSAGAHCFQLGLVLNIQPAASLNGVVANDFANDGRPLVLSFDLHDEFTIDRNEGIRRILGLQKNGHKLVERQVKDKPNDAVSKRRVHKKRKRKCR
nr:hypothetical protein CFP56_66070 [Quercus suber]